MTVDVNVQIRVRVGVGVGVGLRVGPSKGVGLVCFVNVTPVAVLGPSLRKYRILLGLGSGTWLGLGS